MLLFIAALSSCRKTPEQRAESAVEHIADTLDLKDEQVQHLNRIKDEFMAKRAETSKTRDEVLNEAISLMQSPKIEKEKLDSLTEKSQKQADEMIKFFFLKYVEFHDMLTTEQREKAAEELKKMKEHRAGF